jgi:hypothetical protein
MPEETKSFPVPATVTITGVANFTLVSFPTQWETNLEKFVSEPEFNAILTERGRLAAEDSNQEQEILIP